MRYRTDGMRSVECADESEAAKIFADRKARAVYRVNGVAEILGSTLCPTRERMRWQFRALLKNSAINNGYNVSFYIEQI